MNLKEIAAEIDTGLRANRRSVVTDDNFLDAYVLNFAEEAGELVGAYRRYTGKARRNGSLAEVEGEVADVLIGTAILAACLGIDIDKAVEDKAAVIFSRGWSEND